MTTIIFVHPWKGSFNKAILDTVLKFLDLSKTQYQIIDLIQDNFDPVLRENDLKLYSKGQTQDPLVLKYQKTLSKTKRLIFIFPIWWFDVPAVLKGFIEGPPKSYFVTV